MYFVFSTCSMAKKWAKEYNFASSTLLVLSTVQSTTRHVTYSLASFLFLKSSLNISGALPFTSNSSCTPLLTEAFTRTCRSYNRMMGGWREGGREGGEGRRGRGREEEDGGGERREGRRGGRGEREGEEGALLHRVSHFEETTHLGTQ